MTTNKNKKISIIVLLLISCGLLIYNLANPYQESTNDNNIASNVASTAYDNSETSTQTSQLTEDVVVEPQPTQDEIWREKYSGNHLANGAQPYRALYGKNKRSGASSIIVTAPTDQDALVMVKHNGDRIVGHAYIRNSNSYTFHISEGYYQVYFICGTDWCPEKEAPNGQMGFFLSSSTSKDELIYIGLYESLTYTLQSMEHGNFVPRTASEEEAF